MPTSIPQFQFHRAAVSFLTHNSFLSQNEPGFVRLAFIVNKHALPDIVFARNVLDVQNHIWKLVVKNTRFQITGCICCEDLEHQLAERIISPGHRDLHQVRTDPPAQNAQQHDRKKYTEKTDPACSHDSQFAVGIQTAEPKQNSQQQRHWDGKNGKRGKTVKNDQKDHDEFHAACNQNFGKKQNLIHQHHKREDKQSEYHIRNNFFDKIPIENHDCLTLAVKRE